MHIRMIFFYAITIGQTGAIFRPVTKIELLALAPLFGDRFKATNTSGRRWWIPKTEKVPQIG